MRIINKKYLLIILLAGIILTGVIVAKPKKEVKLDNEISKQKINNKTFAMYTETDDGYKEYNNNKFPDMYVLNIEMSKCIDNNGKEVDNILSYNNGEVTVTSGKTTYCYLYFDKSLGLEIKDKNPEGLKTEKVRGAMYRFQGQASDTINNYICFGTSDKNECIKNQDKYMYRIIGIEASTGRVKVIKKEALEQKYQWYTDYDTDIDFPKSNIYKAISGEGFLENPTYVPYDWKEKISDNTCTYGDMLSDSTLGAKQIGEGLYLAETGQKETRWNAKAEAGDEGAQSAEVTAEYSSHNGEIFYYKRHENEKWTQTFDSKVSLMYLHDYHYSVSDDAICYGNESQYAICKTGWMHLNQNDIGALDKIEWTMSRYGWSTTQGCFLGRYVDGAGHTGSWLLTSGYLIRPVFYINASEKIFDGKGTLDNPFIIN